MPINVSGGGGGGGGGDLQWPQLICPRGTTALPIYVSGGPTVAPINLSKGDDSIANLCVRGTYSGPN